MSIRSMLNNGTWNFAVPSTAEFKVNSLNIVSGSITFPDGSTIDSASGIGATGAMGATGSQGIAGATGSQGNQGIQGIQGIQGVTGASGDGIIDGIIGSEFISIDNTDPAFPIISLIGSAIGATGAQGEAGATGQQGIQGEAGATGSQGIQGSQGETGATGQQGIQGEAGATGSQGIQGEAGATGSQGIQGEVGATGSQGIQGEVGATGQQGIQGEVGATGQQGIQGITGSQGEAGATGASNPNALAITVTSNSSNNVFYPSFASDAGSSKDIYIDSSLTYNPSTSVLSAYTLSGDIVDVNTVTTNAIAVKNAQSWSSGGVIVANTNVICPNFTGLATKSTNIAGGLGGQVLYQSAVDTTTKLTNGTAGKYLQTNGTTLAPSWTTPPLYFPEVIVSNSAPVMGGTAYPSVPTTAQSNTGYDGWCFVNSTAGTKIGWSLGGLSPTSVLGDYKGWFFCFTIIEATSRPFLNVYTLPATAPNWYNSRRTFITSDPTSTPLIVNTPYIAYWQQDTSYPIPTRYGHTPFPLVMADGYIGARVGAFADTETYYFMTVSTNSGSAVNSENFIVSQAGNVLVNGIEPFTFLGSAVATANSTNITNGLGGQLLYQSAVNTTAKLTNGTAGQVLTSNGTTLAPSWNTSSAGATPTIDQVLTAGSVSSNQSITGLNNVSATTFTGLASTSTNIAGGNTGNILCQSVANITSKLANGSAGYILTSNGVGLLPSWEASSAGATPTIAQVLTAGSVATAGQTITGLTSITATNFTGLASTSTNLAGGLGGAIPYQSAVNTTALLANGSVGQVLTSAGTTLPPIWQNASASSNATNLLGGAIGQIPYQSAPNTTLFTLAGTQNQVLIANNTGVPSWADAVLLPAYGLCSFRTNNYSQTVQIGSGQTSYINNAVVTTQYISAFGVSFPAGNFGQFTVTNGGAYTVNIRVNLQSAGAILSSAQLFLYSVTGAIIVAGTIQNYQYSTASATSNIVMEVNTIVPLATDTTYQVGFIQNYTGAISAVTINFCYISCNRIF